MRKLTKEEMANGQVVLMDRKGVFFVTVEPVNVPVNLKNKYTKNEPITILFTAYRRGGTVVELTIDGKSYGSSTPMVAGQSRSWNVRKFARSGQIAANVYHVEAGQRELVETMTIWYSNK